MALELLCLLLSSGSDMGCFWSACIPISLSYGRAIHKLVVLVYPLTYRLTWRPENMGQTHPLYTKRFAAPFFFLLSLLLLLWYFAFNWLWRSVSVSVDLDEPSKMKAKRWALKSMRNNLVRQLEESRRIARGLPGRWHVMFVFFRSFEMAHVQGRGGGSPFVQERWLFLFF